MKYSTAAIDFHLDGRRSTTTDTWQRVLSMLVALDVRYFAVYLKYYLQN